MNKAFHNDPKIKSKYLARVRAHRKADELIKGVYWNDGRGCAVGCTLHSGKHSQYPVELGVPQWLGYVQDTLFEGLEEPKHLKFPEAFLQAIPVGADLESVKAPFLIYILKDVLKHVDLTDHPDVTAAVKHVIHLYRTRGTEKEFQAAQAVAGAAAYQRYAKKLLSLMQKSA